VAGLTPFQTVGPYLHLGLHYGRQPMPSAPPGSTIVIAGRIVDGAGAGIADGVLEFWAPGCTAIGRAWTAVDGAYRLTAPQPASRRDPDGTVHAPHFAVRVLARGILTEYLTRVYFDGHPDNLADAVLQQVPAPRRTTLIAGAAADGEYHFDVIVQGDGETVFFDL
jgi:protocatechuate 3,4-dioxygenase, alpha subunit